MLSKHYRQSFLSATNQILNSRVFRNILLIFIFALTGAIGLLYLPRIQPAKAQDQATANTIYFPRLQLGEGWKTIISVTNADSKDLSLTFTTHGQSGSAQSVIAPLSYVEQWLLRVRGQKSLEQRFNLTNLVAGESKTISLESLPIGAESLKIESSGSVIGTASFQSNDGKNAEALSGVRETAGTLNFPPLTKGDLTYKSLLVFNPNQDQATAELIALDEQGNEIARRYLLPIASLESRAITISELLAESELQNAITIKVVSDHNLAGWQIVSSPDTDLVGMPALPAAGKNWVLPVLSRLGELELWNRYAIFNPSNEPAKLVVEFFDEADKHLLTVSLPDLPAGATPFFNHEKYTPTNAAYLSVISDQPVQCYEMVGASLGQGLTAILGVIEDEKRTTTIEIVGRKNGEMLSTYVWSGTEASVVLPSLELSVQGNWLKEFVGFGKKELNSTANENSPESKKVLVFSSAPSQQVQNLAAAGYTVSGKVTLGNNDRQGVAVNLSGPISKSTSTNNKGVYTFTSIANGAYTLRPSKDSYSFDPSSSSVAVSGSNVTNKNFTAKIISNEQPEFKAPWPGKAKISQGNQGSYSHNVCGKRSSEVGNDCAWENTYALDINKNGQNFYVFAPASGTISFVKDDVGICQSGCLGGREIGLKVTGPGGRTFEVIFLHLSKLRKKEGDTVKQGDVIAVSGSSSNNSETGTSPHLHMHVWDTGVGSRDSHTMPISRLWMKKDGENSFKAYESKGDGDDDSSKGSLVFSNQEFWSENPDNEGQLDTIDCNKINGWAWDKTKPNDPIFVDVYDGSTVIAARVLADVFRQDLVNAGKGNGRHGFSYVMPQSIKDGRNHSISVRLASTKIDLNNSPKGFTFSCGVTTPTVTSFRINNDGVSTTSRTVTLNNTATGSPTQYLASESSSFSGASWKTYTTAPSFTLSSGNGNKTVYFKVRNSANVESGVANDSITLNESLPPPTISGYSWDGTPTAGHPFNGKITGSNFISGGTRVFFCVTNTNTCYQQPPSLVSVSNSVSLSVSSVNLGSGSWQIYVQTSAGPSARSTSFNIQPQPSPPTISGYSWDSTPTAGQPFNGTITGTNFISGGTQVFFCVTNTNTCYQQPPSLVSVSSSMSLSVSSVNLTSGSWQIYVQTSAGPSARSTPFSVQPQPPSPPTIGGYSWDRTPTAGQPFNGTITGSNFISGGTQVFFCVTNTNTCYQQPPSLVSVSSSVSLSVSSVNLSSGSWQIYVQTLGRASARSSAFNVR